MLTASQSAPAPATAPFPFLAPSEVLGVLTESLDGRFAESNKVFCDRVMAAMRAEDAILTKYIQNHRLEEWAQVAVNESQHAWQLLVDERTRNEVNGMAGAGAGASLSETPPDTADQSEDEVDLLPSSRPDTPLLANGVTTA